MQHFCCMLQGLQLLSVQTEYMRSCAGGGGDSPMTPMAVRMVSGEIMVAGFVQGDAS